MRAPAAIAGSLLAFATIAVVAAPAQEPSPAVATILARQQLMEAIDGLLTGLERDVANGVVTPDQVVISTDAIAAALDAFPLLFPPRSDGIDAVTAGIVNSASPRIWEEFPAFSALAHEAADVAREAALAEPVATLPALREACQGCHASYLEYDPFAAMMPN